MAHAIELDPKQGRVRRMSRSVLNAARLLGALDSAPRAGMRANWWMVTLTMREGATLEPRDISDAIKCLREWVRRAARWWIDSKQFAYAWTLELTKRGVPHYHVLVKLPRHLVMPMWDSRQWWKHGFTQREKARHAWGYLAKYVSKGTCCHEVPKGFRLFGLGGLQPEHRKEIRWWNAPKWAQEAFGWGADIRPGPAGGRMNNTTGEVLPSPWVVLHVVGRLFLLPKAQTT
jgi:hypothetical protein